MLAEMLHDRVLFVLLELVVVTIGCTESKDALVEFAQDQKQSVEVVPVEAADVSDPVADECHLFELCCQKVFGCQVWREKGPEPVVKEYLEQCVKGREPEWI